MQAFRGGAAILLLATLAACQSSAEYFAQQCAGQGAAGSAEMQQCISDREAQLEQTRALGRRSGGGGPNK